MVTSKDPPPWMSPETEDDASMGEPPVAAGEDASTGADGVVPPADDPGAPADDSDDGEQEDRVPDLIIELTETKERMLRVAADFENFRKRARRDQEEARVSGREEVLRELLPVFDNLERAVEAAAAHASDEAGRAIVDGVAMVQKQFEDGLARFGLKRFSGAGEVFDPNFHEAVAQVDSDEHPPGTVVKEFQKGYMLGERLLRPAMVVVARLKAQAPAEPANNTPATPDDGSGEGEPESQPDEPTAEGEDEAS